jgi:hypothetical protein
MNCKICCGTITLVLRTKILYKYDIAYYRCKNCGFVQTEEPYWLDEAYEEAISIYDVGMVNRNLMWRDLLSTIIPRYFYPNGDFVDYGGGTGLLVRLMRDNGYRFYRYDPHSKNIFARGFDIDDIKHKVDHEQKFEVLTAFEVFEHLPAPLDDIERMLQISDSILFSTFLQSPSTDLRNWSYLATYTGQHISFYSRESLQALARHFNCRLYTNGIHTHLLTRRALCITDEVLTKLMMPSPSLTQRLLRRLSGSSTTRPSLANADFDAIMTAYVRD